MSGYRRELVSYCRFPTSTTFLPCRMNCIRSYSAAETLHTFGGTVGFTLLLHTCDQQLRPHLHLHCLIAAGFPLPGCYTPNRRLPGQESSPTTSVATRTASPSPTTACCPATKAGCASSGVTAVTATRRRLRACPPKSSSIASSNTSYPTVSNVSVTTVAWPTAANTHDSTVAARYLPLRSSLLGYLMTNEDRPNRAGRFEIFSSRAPLLVDRRVSPPVLPALSASVATHPPVSCRATTRSNRAKLSVCMLPAQLSPARQALLSTPTA